jgi:hypothetical protein
MINTDDILKKILLNMKYNPKDSLVENKVAIDNLLLEDQNNNLMNPSDQQIPITMNQIMQFQTWVWKTVDRLGNPDSADKNKKYNTKLCSSPCTPYNRKIKGVIYPGAIDGLWGGNTKKLWDTYKVNYKKSNPSWNQNDIKTNEKVLGQTIPTTTVQIKNFQKWFLEQKEKSKKNSSGLYVTQLCVKPCAYNKAVDGNFGGNTKSLWEKYGNEYKKTNNLWSVSQEWSKESQDAENLKKQRLDLAKVFRFSVSNPSGWDYISSQPNPIDSTIATKYAKISPQECPYYSGWDLLNNIFPKPRKYTNEELQNLYKTTGGDEKYKKALKEKEIDDQKFMDEYGPRTNYGNVVKSDQLGFDRYVADPSGVGQTKFEKVSQSHNDKWNEILVQSKNKIYEDAKKWNKDYDTVVSELKSKCGTPLSFCDSQNNKNCVYISYSDACRKAGGLWVYNSGKNNAWCGCRSMTSMGQILVQFQGPQGTFSKNFNISESFEYQTPETGGRALEEKEENHKVLMWAELGLMGLGFVTGPFGPLFFGASALVGFADGVKYYQEGDTHMGVMMMALGVLGAAEVGAAFKLAKAEAKAINFIARYGDDAFTTLIRTSVKNPELLTAAEKSLVYSLKQATYSSQRILGKEMSKKIAQNFIKDLPNTFKVNKWGWKEFARIFWNFAENNPTIKGMVIYIAGVPYTIDQIYLSLYGNDNDRKRSSIGTLFDYFYGNLIGQEEALNNALSQFSKELQKEADTEEKVIALAEAMNKMVGNNLTNLRSEESIIEECRSFGQLEGFDEKRYEEISKQQLAKEKELKEKEGCDKLSSLQELSKKENPTWKSITKIEYIKQIQNKTDKIKLETTSCSNIIYYFMSMETSQPKTLSGQIPYNKTILDNPTNF